MAGQGSARVTLKEIDLSQVRDPEQLPQGVPAAVVGSAKRGPAFVPKTFATIQQFNETFGSLLEVSKDSNANRFGPLALNEWMRNSEAGTFLRVLGVGDGNAKSASGRVTDAGFVVGENTSYDSSNELQTNQNATGLTADNKVAALKSARTHFLGCFMKDQGNSTFLQDAGVQTAQGAGFIDITLKQNSVIKNGSTLKITYISNAGNADQTAHVTFTFLDGEAAQAAGNDANIHSSGTPAAVLDDLLNAINGGTVAGSADGAVSLHLIATRTNNTLRIQSKHNVLGSDTNNIKVEFDINSDLALADIDVGGKNASEANQTVRFGSSGNTAAKFEVVMSDNPANDGVLTFSLIQNDGDATLEDKSVEYKFLTDLTDTDAGNDVVPNTYHINAAGVTEIKIGANPVETLENLQAALARVASAGTISLHQGLVSSSLDRANNKLIISQKNLGDAGNSVATGGTGNITALTATNTTITVAANLTNARTSTTTTKNSGNFAGTPVFMFGGSDSAENKSLTLKLTGNAVEDDKLDIRVQEVDDFDGTRTLHMLFKTAANTGNGQSATPRHVKIGADLQETLYNIKNAILDTANKHANASIHLDVNVVVSDADDSLTITYKNNGARNTRQSDKQGGLSGDVTSTVEVGEYATFTNPSGFSLIGNHGPKTVNFTGGGGATTPVVRGVLMSPQGIIPSMDISNAANYSATPSIDTNIIKKIVAANNTSLLNFGNTASSELIGYQLGTVTVDNEQVFKLVLNGFSSEKEASVLTCSFNPESANYFAKVLNTDPEKIEERGHYLYAHWDVDPAVARADISGLSQSAGAPATNDMIGFCIHSKGDRALENSVGGVATANTPDFESFDSRFKTAKSPWFMSQKLGGSSKKLFRLYSLDDGIAGNDRFRILISNIRAGSTSNDYGTFDLTLEAFDSDPISGEKLIQWKSLTLNPESRNYIGRVIGDKHMYYDFDRTQSKQRLVEEGNHDIRNKYVRVEVSVDVETADGASWLKTALPCGFKQYKTLNLSPRAGLFAELGTNGTGTNSLLKSDAFDVLKVLPLPFVKHITRSSGTTQEASSALAWGVKFAKVQNADAHKELSEIRFNSSIESWTKFFPDMGVSPFAVDSIEEFSLENIAVADASDIDWSTSQYIRSGENEDATALSKTFITLGTAAKIGKNVKYLKFRCLMQGGFDGLNIFNKEKSALSSVAAFREANEEVANSSIFTGPTVIAFQRAIDVLSDKSATEFQLLAIPGMREPRVTDYAITACESRFDAMLVMDIEQTNESKSVIIDLTTRPHVTKTIEKFTDRSLDTSFAAAYFPDVISRRSSNNTPIQVPPSVCMLGVMSQNDTLADPWFAPAGLTRGRLNGSNVKVQMSRDLLDDLYDADINPIYEPAGRSGEVYAFGQKTLMQDQSALDRINVRRLLINIRRKVKAVANTLLFEPNRASTLERFSSLVEPIMAEVQARQGVDRYKVQIDTSTTTQNDVENNTIRGKVYLQPTKSVEFISLDFVVTNSID